jgi:MFS family permease
MKRKLGMLNYAAVLGVFLFSGAGTLMNAAIQSMMDAWPQLSPTSVRMVVSLPPLISLPIMLIVGVIVGKKISYRFCAVLGTALIACGGIAPYFFYSNWSLVLMFRAILGIGVGFIGMRNSLVLRTVPPAKQAAYIGYGTVLMNLGNVIANPIVGVLVRFTWRHAFLFDVLALIPLILMIAFLVEPENEMTAEKAETKEKINESGIGLNWRIYYYIVLQFVTTASLYPLLAGMSTFMADKNLGSTAMVGTVLSIYTLAGACVNMIISPLQKFFKKYTITTMCLLVAIGQGLILFSPSIPTIFVGCSLAGIGFTSLVTMFQVYNGQAAPVKRVAFSSAVILSMLQLGIFASNYFISLCHAMLRRSTEVESVFGGCLIVFIILAVLSAVLKIVPETTILESQKTNET